METRTLDQNPQYKKPKKRGKYFALGTTFVGLCTLFGAFAVFYSRDPEFWRKLPNLGSYGMFEDFESSRLYPWISLEKKGEFFSEPEIKEMTDFGSKRAFGFGTSHSLPSSAQDYVSHISLLRIRFPRPCYVSHISFKEMERYPVKGKFDCDKGNWGSDGSIFVDGIPISNGITPHKWEYSIYQHFGRQPYNDSKSDVTFRLREYVINKKVSQIELKVFEITALSEIYIDDLLVR